MSWFVETHSPAQVQWPAWCVCCGQPATTAIREIPYCALCARHARRPPLARLLPACAILWAFAALILSAGNIVLAGIVWLGGIAAAVWWALKRPRPTACTARFTTAVVAGMKWKGTRQYLFASENYARRFAEANGGALLWKQGERKPAS